LGFHSTAIVDPNAKIGDDVTIGPFSVIEAGVSIDDRTIVGNNVTISSGTRIGKDCKIFHSASIGAIPQDLKYNNEETFLYIGDRTVIREFVSINKGTSALGKTEIGSDCLLMASVHVAHDCVVGNNVIMSNLTTLGGHVNIDDWAILSGGVLVHQFCNISKHAFIGAGALVTQDVPPFILAAGSPVEYSGINSVGLKRRGFSIDDRKELKNIYKMYFRSKNNRKENLSKIKKELASLKYTNLIVEFIKNSERGII
tara:strand:- start:150 stop:917 length:768 start_codon:yes stop_codon:yes gene_type:complete